MSVQEHEAGNGNGNGKRNSARIGKSKKYPQDDFQDDGVTHGNGVNPETIQNYVGRIENLHADIAKEQSEMMLACKVIHKDIKQVYAEAKKDGLNNRALRTLVKERALLRKATECVEALDGDEVDLFTMMKDALGDFAGLPLGQAALDRVS